MAKQRGLIQISGKLNDMCYFQRKGSTSGLIRRINTGMSERVRSGEEYENLRTVNSYFGACLLYASVTLNMISNRMQYMLKPNRLSLLAGRLFRLRNHFFGSPTEGSAGFDPNFSYIYSYIFDKCVKNKLFDHFGSINRKYLEVRVEDTININISELELESFCKRYKAVGCVVSVIGSFYIYKASKTASSGKYLIDDYGSVSSRRQSVWQLNDGELEISIPPTGVDDAANYAIITVAPVVRFIGGRPVTNYTGAACGLVGIFYNG